MEDIFKNLDLSILENSDEGIDFNELESGDEPQKKESDSSLNNENDLEDSFLEEFADFDVEETEETEDSDNEEPDDNETIEDKNNGQAPSDKSSSSPIESLISSLFEEGVLPSLEEDDLKNIKTGEDLINAIRTEIKNNEYADLTEEQKEYLEAVREGVSYEEFAKSKDIENAYANIGDDDIEDEKNENLRYQLIKNSFLLKGIDAEKADKLAKRSFSSGEDVEDAKSSLEELRAYEKRNIEKLKQDARDKKSSFEKTQKEKWEKTQNKIESFDEIIPGIKLNSLSKSAVKKLINTPSSTDAQGRPINEVVDKLMNDEDYLVKVHYVHHITDGFTKWDKLVSSAKTKAIRTLDEKLRIQDSRMSTGASGTYSNKNEKSKGLFNAIDKVVKRDFM